MTIISDIPSEIGLNIRGKKLLCSMEISIIPRWFPYKSLILLYKEIFGLSSLIFDNKSISSCFSHHSSFPSRFITSEYHGVATIRDSLYKIGHISYIDSLSINRSEERRVGKECRYR